MATKKPTASAAGLISSAQKSASNINSNYKSQSGAIASSTKKSTDSIANSAKSASDKKTSSAQTTANKYATDAKNSTNGLINKYTTGADNYTKSGEKQTQDIANKANQDAQSAIDNYNSQANGVMNDTRNLNNGLVDKYYNSNAYTNAQNLQNMGLDDWAKKNGIDISQAYADNQANTAAQAQRNILDSQSRQNTSENQNALNQIKDNFNNAGRSMDQNYFNQFAGANQANANRGLSGGIAAAQNMQLGMSKQRELGNLFDTRQTATAQENNRFANQNQDISNNLSQVERQRLLDSQNIRQNMLTTSVGLLNNDRTSANNWANSNWNMTDNQMNNNNTMMGNQLDTLGKSTSFGLDNINNNANRQTNSVNNATTNYLNSLGTSTNLGVNNVNNYANNMTNNLNTATNHYLDNINNQATSKINNANTYSNSQLSALNNYTNNATNNLSDYTKMGVNDIYNTQQLAQQAANRAASLKAAKLSAGSAGGGTVPSSAQGYLSGYQGALKAQNSPGGSYNTPLDQYAQSQMKKPGIAAVQTSKSPLVHKYFPNPVVDPTTVANNPNLSAWDKMKLMGL